VTGLESEELDLLRQETVGWFPDRCDTFGVVVTDDPYGGQGSVKVPKLTDVPCMIDPSPVHSEERALIGVVAGVQIYSVTVPAETDVANNDRLTITTQNNLALRVQAVLAPESWDIETRLLCSEEGVSDAT
jgi:hypothetical protein